MADYILTYSKIRFYPLEPVLSDIRIEDIAHALSLMTRANGHFKHFYSVAQHAVNCCKEARARGYSERVQLGCLLHDSSESYISDLTRPVKRNLSQYFVIEEKLQKLIYDRFGLGDLTDEEAELIKSVDDALLYFEFKVLMDVDILETIPESFMEHDFSQRDFTSVENEFICIFNKLTDNGAEICCVGVDGCRDGWVAAAISEKGFCIDVFRSVRDVCIRYPYCENMLIDMPIGLPESTGDIRPDAAARVILKSKSSSVFNTPCRQAVYTIEYNRANEVNRQILGKGLSSQSHAISSKIREIDQYLDSHPGYKNRLMESHPEVCFAMLNSGEPIYENKKTEEGMRRRILLLEKYYPKTREIVEYMLGHPDLVRMTDDVIDALCMAVTGLIGLKNGLKQLPERPMKDSRGIVMQIVYAEP